MHTYRAKRYKNKAFVSNSEKKIHPKRTDYEFDACRLRASVRLVELTVWVVSLLNCTRWASGATKHLWTDGDTSQMVAYVVWLLYFDLKELKGLSLPKLSYLPGGRRSRSSVLRTSCTTFPYTERPRPANNMFILFCLWRRNEANCLRIGLQTMFLSALLLAIKVKIKLIGLKEPFRNLRGKG